MKKQGEMWIEGSQGYFLLRERGVSGRPGFRITSLREEKVPKMLESHCIIVSAYLTGVMGGYVRIPKGLDHFAGKLKLREKVQKRKGTTSRSQNLLPLADPGGQRGSGIYGTPGGLVSEPSKRRNREGGPAEKFLCLVIYLSWGEGCSVQESLLGPPGLHPCGGVYRTVFFLSAKKG